MSMNAADSPLFRPVGWDGLLVEVADLEAAEAMYRLVRRLIADPAVPLEPPRDVVPAARTVLLDTVADVDGWQRAIRRGAAGVGDDLQAARTGDAAEVTVLRTRYQGPDLEAVAARWSCPADEVVRRHAAATYRVAFCGFAPGFAYCTSDPPAPPVPRREEPRTSVPAGSVALAGRFCGIYPRAMPGGWQVIGSTDAVLFDPDRAEPALLNPGDRVRFEPAT
jgi:KipI family sensor histidine kinase inhibitor